MPEQIHGFIVLENGSAINIAELECLCFIDFDLWYHQEGVWNRDLIDWMHAAGYKTSIHMKSGHTVYSTTSVEELRRQL